MAVEETPISLPKDIHRNTQQTHHNLNTADDHKCSIDAGMNDPVIPTECKSEGKEVLED